MNSEIKEKIIDYLFGGFIVLLLVVFIAAFFTTNGKKVLCKERGGAYLDGMCFKEELFISLEETK